MKKKLLLLLPFAGILAYIGLCSYSGGAAISGGIDGTGASGAGGCSCHTHATTTTVALELDTIGGGVRTQYIAGGHYTVKITGTNTSTTSLPDFGFQVAVVKLTGAGTGTAADAGALASTGLPASCQYSSTGSTGLPMNIVEQNTQIAATTGTGGSGTTYVESIPWTAPAVAGTGSIKLYGVINAVNFDGGSGGDKWNNGNATITEYVVPTTAPITGTTTVCVGATTALSSTYTTGTWSSGSPSVATISTSGSVYGVAPGTSVISYNEGTSGIATATVTVIAPPTAGVISGSVTVCQGANILLTDVGGTTGGTWSSTTTSIATVNGAGVVHGVAGGLDSIKYIVTNGCGSATAAYGITVNPLPVAGTITGSTFVCSTTPQTYTVTGTGGTWSVVNPNANISTDGVVTGVSAGYDTIKYSVTNACGTVSATKNIVISIPPVAGPITGPATICTGTPTTYTGANTGGFWSITPTSVATVNFGSGAVTGITTGTVTLQYVINNFCGTDTARTTITVGSSPSAGSITGAAGLCVGANTTLTDAGSGTWSSDNGNATVTSLGVVHGVTAGTDSIRYTVTNSCGTAVAIHAILISNTPDAGTISGPSTVCQGATISLSETATGGTWSETSGGFTASVSTMGVVTGNNGGADVINYTVSNGCGSVTATYPVTVNPLPSPGVITGGPAVVCAGSSVTLVDTTSGGIWSASDTNVTVVGGVVTATSGGADTIFYSVTNSCGTVSATTFVLVNSGATAGVIMGDGAVCVDSAIILTDSLPGGAWSLSNGNALISGGVLVGVTPGFDTVYYSLVTGCGLATAAEVIDIMPAGSCGPLAVNNVANTGVKVYPNPSNGAFTIELPQSVSSATITITDVMGKVVADRNVTAAKSAIVSFDLSGLAAGNYIMKVDAGAKIYREQITIAK